MSAFRSSMILFLGVLSVASSVAQNAPRGDEQYGNVGDPYATESGKPSCKKILNECGERLSPGDYCLARDVTAAPNSSGKCFVLSEGVRLDLGGHTVFGRLFS